VSEFTVRSQPTVYAAQLVGQTNQLFVTSWVREDCIDAFHPQLCSKKLNPDRLGQV